MPCGITSGFDVWNTMLCRSWKKAIPHVVGLENLSSIKRTIGSSVKNPHWFTMTLCWHSSINKVYVKHDGTLWLMLSRIHSRLNSIHMTIYTLKERCDFYWDLYLWHDDLKIIYFTHTMNVSSLSTLVPAFCGYWSVRSLTLNVSVTLKCDVLP